MTGNDKLGAINVKMGDGNTVGHIGHKITYYAPPPPKNAIYQNGIVVGEFEGQPLFLDNTYSFPKLFVESSFDETAEFNIQDVRLSLERKAAESSVAMGGRPPQRTFWNAVCRIVS